MEKFNEMAALLHAVWPGVSQINWEEFLPYTARPYDEHGVPKYTGLLMHRRGGGCVGASTVPVGFLPRPELAAITAVRKTLLLAENSHVFASMEMRDPSKNYWGGGIRTSDDHSISYAITGFPEIGDHLLLANMMVELKIMRHADYHKVVGPHSKYLSPVLTLAGMDTRTYNTLNHMIAELVRGSM